MCIRDRFIDVDSYETTSYKHNDKLLEEIRDYKNNGFGIVAGTAGIPGVKSKFQHLHAGEAAVPHQLTHGVAPVSYTHLRKNSVRVKFLMRCKIVCLTVSIQK